MKKPAQPTGEPGVFRHEVDDGEFLSQRDDKGRLLGGLVAAHGAFQFRDTGKLPDFAADVRPELDALVEGYATDLGGSDELTTAQREALGALRTIAGMRRLVQMDLAKRGLLTARGRVRASTHLLMALVDREERLMKLLGMKRQQKPVRQTLQDWIAAEQGVSDDAA